MKTFLIKDKSGRGFTVKCSLDRIINEWDDEEDYNGDFLHGWANDAETGDEWECNNLKVVRIE